MADNDILRLFFALWPDDATRDAVDRVGRVLHKEWGGRRMRTDTLHLTLAFLGATPARLLQVLLPGVDAIRAEPFELVFDRPGYWRHNRIGWLGASQTPPQLGELVAALNTTLQAAGLAIDPRPYAPHVTLLRNARGGDPPACEPVRWPVRDFVLVASRTEPEGARYEVVRRWPAGAALTNP